MSNEKADARTSVVTSFLLRHRAAPGGDEILLVRRSERVRTYQGSWAGISGYLEAGVTPLEQAYTELREELGLDRTTLHLNRAGPPLPVEDETQNLRWLVFPFLFTLNDPQVLTLDWEALEMRWVSPSDLATYTTVPKLLEALAEVYPLSAQNQAGDHDQED
ncbi:MAG: NUDIX domain-containing protein [Ktedonobacterales bacterium]